MTPEPETTYIFNGIDADTGEYLAPPMGAAGVVRAAKSVRVDKEHLAELKARDQDVKTAGRHYGVKFGVDPKKLSETGWGVIFPPGADAAREALQPLLKLRSNQAGARYHEYSGADAYQAGMSSLDFLTRHDVGPGPADPDRMPYYLLIVGGPDVVPFDFQYQLDVQYAVGRICFDTLEGYANYARSVVLAESEDFAAPKTVALFGTAHEKDISTQLSAQQLVAPLASKIGADPKGWTLRNYLPADSTRQQLSALLGGADTPGLLFTATHGIGFPLKDGRQVGQQGALLCQDWSGGAALDASFTADQLADDATLLGLIAVHFACFGAGTPQITDFADRKTGMRGPIADQPFVSRLPQRMLSHPRGGALAVVGHIDRALACSFRWDGPKDPQVEVYHSTLRALMDGYPVGAALEFMNMRYAELSTLVSQRLDNRDMKKIDDRVLAGLWIANNDARNFVVIGDPAVRLKATPEASQERRMTIRSTVTTAPPKSAPAPLAAEAAPQSIEAPPPSATETEYMLGFGSPDGAQLKDVLVGIFQKVGDTLAKAYQSLTTVEVTTYVSNADGVQYEDGHFTGARLRAVSRISLDGKAQVCVPTTDGKLDEALWKLHSDMVQQALSQRVEILKLAAGMASHLVAGIKLP
ncbi:MAG TPA: hypothetical protein VKU19_02145 [Bryobacteraceae bacterium]|nr:hypothetical protein [Bryobacteraceae bacterium]